MLLDPVPITKHSFNYYQNPLDENIPQTGTISKRQENKKLSSSGPTYHYEVTVSEPLTVRRGRHYYLKVGAYVLDNAFSGYFHPASGADYEASNLGEGVGFLFYTDPGRPSLVPGSMPEHAHVRWDPIPPSSINTDEMQVTYTLTVCSSRDSASGDPGCLTVHNLTTPQWAGALQRSQVYATVNAEFQSTDQGHLVDLTSQDEKGTLLFSRPPTATAALPRQRATTTSGRSRSRAAAPTRPTTSIATSPTLSINAGALHVVPQPYPYAWLLALPEGPAAEPAALLPTTTRNNPDPSQFTWPVGRPLDLLPALSEQPQRVRLILRDVGIGTSALLYPTSITTLSYTLDNAGCSSPLDSATQEYHHDRAAYPYEIQPISQHHRLVGGLRFVWQIRQGPISTPVPVCSIDAYLAAHRMAHLSASGIPITVTIHEQLTTTIRVITGIPGPDTLGYFCALSPTFTPPRAPAREPDGLAVPQPALQGALLPQGGECAAPTVGLASAEDALLSPISAASGASASLLPQQDGRPYRVTGHGNGTSTLTFSVSLTQPVTFHYHPLFLREVAP